MSQSRLSTTAKLFVTLAKGYFESELPDNDPTLKQNAIPYIKIGQIEGKLKLSEFLSSDDTSIKFKATLNDLQKINKTAHELYLSQSKPLLEKKTQDTARQAELVTHFSTLKTATFDLIKEIFAKVNATPQAHHSKLNTEETKLNVLEKNIDRLTLEQAYTNQRLTQLTSEMARQPGMPTGQESQQPKPGAAPAA